MGQWNIQEKFGTPYVFVQPLKPAALNLVHKFGLALAYQKTTVWIKIGGGWAKGASKKVGTPYLFLQPLKLATEKKIGTQHEFWFTLPNTSFR